MERTDFMAEDSLVVSTDFLRHTPMLAPIPAHSVDLIMVEFREASPLADSQALAVASMVAEVSTEAAASTEEEADTGNSLPLPQSD
jgi:hypothetical protein